MARFRRGPRQPSETAALLLALVVLALVAPGSTVRSEVSFSSAERAVIARNTSLRTSVVRDPALVRRVLDRMAAPGPRILDPGAASDGTRDLSLPAQDDHGFDPGNDPDLGSLQRASPEAAHDLFQLLKQASGNKQKESE